MYSQSTTTSFIIMLTVLISSFLTKSTTIMAKVSVSSSTRSNIFGSMRSYCGSSAGCSKSKSSSSSSSNIIAFVAVTNTHHQHQPLSSSSAVTTRRQYHHHHQHQQLRLHRLRQQQPSRSSSFGRLYSSSSSSSNSNSGDSNNSDSDDHVHVHVHHNVEAKANKVLEVQHQEEKIIITPLPLPSQSQSQSKQRQRQRILKQFQSNVNDNDNDNDNDNEANIEKQIQIAIDTLDWLENVVIGYNLCPFAEKSFSRNQLEIDIVIGSNQTEILSRVLNECLRLKDNPGTTLIVCPNLYPKNFIAYLEVLNILTDGVLIDNDLMNDIQIAPFHPLFIFGDNSNSNNDNDNDNNNLDNDNIENYTNRSPYPIFHILREEEVSYAVDVLDGDDSIVWKRNIDFLNKLQYMFSEKNNDNLNITDDITNTDINKKELLRSVFLKGKANDANASTSSSGNKCPISIIKQYEERIQSILKEFRGR